MSDPTRAATCTNCGKQFVSRLRWLTRCAPCGRKRAENCATVHEDFPAPESLKIATVHQTLIDSLVQQGWHCRGLRKQMQRQLNLLVFITLVDSADAWNDAMSLRDELDQLRVIPDAWRVTIEDEEQGWAGKVFVLNLAEVEVENHISDAKMSQYESLWWGFDDTAFAHFRLWRVDRFGQGHEFDFQHYSYNQMRALP